MCSCYDADTILHWVEPILEATVMDCGNNEKELEGYITALQAKKREMKEELRQLHQSMKETVISSISISNGDIEGTGDVERKVAKAESAFERIAEKSKAQSESQAEADRAKAVAVKEEEVVVTVRETEKAERSKAVELVQARQNAEREAIKINVAAEAEKTAAQDQAEAVRTLANADADKQRIKAEGEAEAEKLRADAAEKRYAVDAEGKRALNEAHNILSTEQIAMQIRMALVKYLPDIIRESVKPMEKIEGIKIIQVDGLHGGNSTMASGSDAANGNLADQVVNGALRYRSQAPLIDSLLTDIGLSAGDINGLTEVIKPSQEEVIKPKQDIVPQLKNPKSPDGSGSPETHPN